MQKCLTCGGVYSPVLADGTQYFHACPPLGVAEIRAALAAKTLVLPAADAARLKAAADLDVVDPVPPLDPSRADAVLATLVIPRPNARDENLPGTRAADKGQIKAAGAGVVAVP